MEICSSTQCFNYFIEMLVVEHLQPSMYLHRKRYIINPCKYIKAPNKIDRTKQNAIVATPIFLTINYKHMQLRRNL